MIKRYRERSYIDAIQFENTPTSIQAIIDFVGLPVSVEYTSSGVQMRIIRNPYNVVIVKVGECLVKHADDSLSVCTVEHLDENYDEVIE